MHPTELFIIINIKSTNFDLLAFSSVNLLRWANKLFRNYIIYNVDMTNINVSVTGNY